MRKMLAAMVLLMVGFSLGWFLFVPVLAKIPELFRYKKNPELSYNGQWAASLKVGGPQASAMLRAMVANFGLGANTADEAVYWVSLVDANGKRLTGGRTYEIHFEREPAIQKIAGFWSLCVYNSKDQFVPNPIKRYNLGSVSSLVKNADGSFVLHLSPEPTGPQENWLPSPLTEEPIVLQMRMYAPMPEVLKKPEKSPMPRIVLIR